MSRSWAAGGLLAGMAVAGAVLLPSSGTLALLSDRAAVGAEAGAASLALTAGPAAVDGVTPAALVLPGDGTGEVQVVTTGELPWTLQLEVLDADGGEACDVAGRLGAETAVGSGPGPGVDACGVLLTRAGTGPTTGVITVQQDGGSGTGAWTGLLRLTLQQQPGGFSDVVDVPVQVIGDDATAAGSPAVDDPAVPGGAEGGPPTAGRPGAGGSPSGSASGSPSGSASGTAAGRADPPPGSAPAAGSASPSGSAPAAPSTSGTPSQTSASAPPEPTADSPSSVPDDDGTTDPAVPEGATSDGDPATEG
jgi:hypothetical protein